jgi:hypothetical protein
MAETLYDVLGVSEDADSEQIEAAYRERVKQCHPDLSDHPRAAQRLEWVVRAADVLTDPAERQRYDRLGHAAYCDAEGWSDGASTADSQEYTDATARERQRDAVSEDTTATTDNGTTAADATGHVGEHQAAERAWDSNGGQSGADERTGDGPDGSYRDWDPHQSSERTEPTERDYPDTSASSMLPQWLGGLWREIGALVVFALLVFLLGPSVLPYGPATAKSPAVALMRALGLDPSWLLWGALLLVFVGVPLVGGGLLIAAIVFEDFKLEL